MIAKRLSLTLALLLVSSLGLSHWYSIRQIDSPPTEQRTTTYRCIDSTGITVATNQTFAASEQACGALAAERGGVFFIEEHDSIARVTRTHEVRGSTSLRVSQAEASLIVVSGGSGGTSSGGSPGGSLEYAGLTPDLYATCSASGLGSGDGSSEANAMRWNSARTSASSGDIVGVLPGSGGDCTGTAQDNRFSPAHPITNNGTLGDPTIFVAKYAAAYLSDPLNNANRTELNHDVTSYTDVDGSPGGPVIGCDSADDYIWWVGFAIDGASAYSHADTGPVVLSDSTGCEVHQMYVQGWDNTIVDNYCGIYVSNAADVRIKNNIITGFHRSPSDSVNACGIMTYSMIDGFIEHNEVYDNYTGIYVKGRPGATPGNSPTVRLNRIRNVEIGGHLNDTSDTGSISFTQNVVYDFVQTGIQMAQAVSGTRSVLITNNTVADPHSTAEHDAILIGNVSSGYGGHTIDDNLLETTANSGSECINGSAFVQSNALFDSIDGNHCFDSANRRWAWNGTQYTSATNWQTASGASNEQTGDPDFVDAASGDYSLGGSTTATGKGAYITGNEEIGVEASPTL